MSGILAKLTVKPLLWACGLQLAAIAALGVALWAQGVWWEGKVADVGADRDHWKVVAEARGVRVAELSAANFAFESVNGTLRRLLDEARGEAARLGEEGREAVAAARAAEADATRTLDVWMARYADQVRIRDCASAWRAVQAHCPAMEGY